VARTSRIRFSSAGRGVLLLNVLFGVTISNKGGTDSVSATGSAVGTTTINGGCFEEVFVTASSVPQLNIGL
jgi:hypothetical protein